MSLKKSPRVSILLPTYNRPVLLRRAIASVLPQTFSDWELLVVDDSPNEDSVKVVQDFAKNDPRIISVRDKKNDYITEALNHGLEAARGDLIARLDSDDYWIDKEKLAKQVEFLDTHPHCVVTGGGVVVVNEHEKELFRYFKKESDEEIRKRALFANPFSHTTVMFRADIAREVGAYGTKRYVEDWDLWLRMGMRGTFYNFQEYFTAYTLDGENKSLVHQRAHTKRILEVISDHRKEYPGFFGAYLLNAAQYTYSFLPTGVKKVFQTSLSSLKRKSF